MQLLANFNENQIVLKKFLQQQTKLGFKLAFQRADFCQENFHFFSATTMVCYRLKISNIFSDITQL